MVTKLRVAIPLRVIPAILFPKQLFGYPNSAKLFYKVVQIGLKMIKTFIFICRIPCMELPFQNWIIQCQKGLDAQEETRLPLQGMPSPCFY